uniref:Protein kinase domain-containing protein n=1 Tax=Leersia perrieri TaxID=77586 RepID=A0A0D9X9F0_9ORYZ
MGWRVYRGSWSEWNAEVNHINVVKLLGCCLETQVSLVVYKFISNGCLDHHLHVNEQISLSWDNRVRIALEVSRALAYLHSAATIPIFHKDCKASNILLNGNLTTKVSDFGASKYISIDQTELTTAVQGTIGYLDPMYYYMGQLADKIFLVLNCLLQKKLVYKTDDGDSLKKSWLEIYPQVMMEEGDEEVQEVALLAVMCTKLNGQDRPTMEEVEMTLENLLGKKKVASHKPKSSVHDISQSRRDTEQVSRQYSMEQEMVLSESEIHHNQHRHLNNSINTVLLMSLAPVLLLQLLAVAAAAASPAPAPEKKCNTTICGNISIEYPFGVQDGCYHPGFNLTCNQSYNPPRLFLGDGTVQVLEISIPNNTVRVNSSRIDVAKGAAGVNVTWGSGLPNGGAYFMPASGNGIILVGCNVQVEVREPISMSANIATYILVMAFAQTHKEHITVVALTASRAMLLYKEDAKILMNVPTRRLTRLSIALIVSGGSIALFLLLASPFVARELQKATTNFDRSRQVGDGGHGVVFKGILDLKVVAIKNQRSEISEFINEVAILSQVNHRNVVKLLGCCPFTIIFIPISLSWDGRLRISLDVVLELSYLHSASSMQIYHRDIKSQIYFLMIVSDFGASKYTPIDRSEITTVIQGTIGYLDHMYYYTGRLTDKSDVFSFGVLLMELLTRKKPISDIFDSGESLVSQFVSLLSKGNLVEIIDYQVREEEGGEVLEVATLAEMCTKLKGEERPSMREVEMALENILSKRSPFHNNTTPSRPNENQVSTLYMSIGVTKEASRQYAMEDEILLFFKQNHGLLLQQLMSQNREIDDFINEVVILSQVNHRNVFISNGCLDHHLHVNEQISLSWDNRVRIALEVSRALAYLHTSTTIPIFHMDNKASNILLNGNLTTKVSDFGASNYIPIDQTELTTAVQGTIGYLTQDELLTRKKLVYKTDDGDSLVLFLASLFTEEKLVEIIDPQVMMEEGDEEVQEVALLEVMCTKLNGQDRPTMKEVEMTLDNLLGKKKVASHKPKSSVHAISQSRRYCKSNRRDTEQVSRQYSMEQEMVLSERYPR